jgi:hypothetical protein
MIPLPWLKVFDVIPGYVYAAAIAVLVIGGGSALAVQTYRVSQGQTKVATLERDAATLRAERENAARQYADKRAEMQATHAKQQQEIVDAYSQKLRDADSRRVADLARADRVRGNAAAAAARDRDAAKDDPAACQRVADRNGVLYGLASEGFSLVVEGRSLLAARDAAVETLKNIITNDRAAICGGP